MRRKISVSLTSFFYLLSLLFMSSHLYAENRAHHYQQKSLMPSFYYSGEAKYFDRVYDLLDELASYDVGLETLEAIQNSGNEVEIIHNKHSRNSAGVTGASMTRNLTNGVGEDVYIKMDFSIPDEGSHVVYDRDKNEIEFSALQNFFHELSHARHKTNGTWRYFDSEGQAIEDENRLRKEQAGRRGVRPRLRYGMDGRMVR